MRPLKWRRRERTHIKVESNGEGRPLAAKVARRQMRRLANSGVPSAYIHFIAAIALWRHTGNAQLSHPRAASVVPYRRRGMRIHGTRHGRAPRAVGLCEVATIAAGKAGLGIEHVCKSAPDATRWRSALGYREQCSAPVKILRHDQGFRAQYETASRAVCRAP